MSQRGRYVLRTDGTRENIEGPLPFAEIGRRIGADTLDTVTLRHLGLPLMVMAVDDKGYEFEVVDHGDGHFEHRVTKALKPVNKEATRLYLANCLPGTTHAIVGDVYVCPDDDYA